MGTVLKNITFRDALATLMSGYNCYFEKENGEIGFIFMFEDDLDFYIDDDGNALQMEDILDYKFYDKVD